MLTKIIQPTTQELQEAIVEVLKTYPIITRIDEMIRIQEALEETPEAEDVFYANWLSFDKQARMQA